MNPAIMFVVAFGSLLAAMLVGATLRRLLPEGHLTGDTKDAVKLTAGFLATMTALILGLLISSAKNSYDTVRSEVIQMSAKVTFLDRVLEAYGPEAADARAHFRDAVENAIRSMWPEGPSKLEWTDSNVRSGDAVYVSVQRLTPHDDLQRDLKNQAASLAVEIGQLRTLLMAQLIASISKPMLMVLIYWLAIIFLSFSLLAPSNRTATLALVISAFSVSSAVFMILELDRPFGGLVQISSEPLRNALAQMAK